MGRPAIGKFTAIRLPPEMLAKLDEVAGAGKRSAFIRAAVEYAFANLENIDINSSEKGELEFITAEPARNVRIAVKKLAYDRAKKAARDKK